MLRPGRYKSEHDGNVFQAYRYVMEAKETAKSYIFKLLEVENRYADDHIEIMFGGKKRIVLPKDMFVGIEDGTGREVYRGIETQRYYLREVYANQRFAKWYLCGERRVPEDGREPRPNLIFQLGDQTEKVVYDDWNGVAAYKDQFNENFREKVSK